MVIVGVGVDLVSPERFRAILDRASAARFVRRVFAECEAEYCSASHAPAQAFAARFAAKEAVAKAFGVGFGAGLTPLSIVVTRGVTGAPSLELRGPARRLAEQRGVSRIHLSLSHTAKSACAFVILESEYPLSPVVQHLPDFFRKTVR
jgi:holo-[acyl-carrier protein] synthase